MLYQLPIVPLCVFFCGSSRLGLPHWRIGGFQYDACVTEGVFAALGIVLKDFAPPRRLGF